MAVRRQRTQVFNQPVGIVQTRAGAQEVAGSISRAANTMAQLAYQDAADEAQKKGIELAQAVEEKGLRTINPETGKPEAYKAPSTFGQIAAESYQRVIDKRFEDSMNTELRLKAQEISLKFPFAPEAYDEAMDSYISEMSKNAQGKYKSYIETTGSKYLALTKLNITERIATKAREDAAKSIGVSVDAAADDAYTLARAGGYKAREGEEQSETDAIVSREVANTVNGINSGLVDVGSDVVAKQKINEAIARGAVEHLMSRTYSSLERNAIELAIRTRGEVIGAVPTDLRDDLKELLKYVEPSNIERVLSHSSTVAADYNAVEQDMAEILKDQLAEKSRASELQFSDSLLDFGTQATGFATLGFSFENPSAISSVIGKTNDLYNAIKDAEEARFKADQTYTRAEFESNLKDARQEALRPFLIQAAAQGNVEEFRIAFNTRNPEDMANLTAEQKQVINDIYKSDMFNAREDIGFVREVLSASKNDLRIAAEREKFRFEISESITEAGVLAETGGLSDEAFNSLVNDVKNSIGPNKLTADQAESEINRLTKQRALGLVESFARFASSRDLNNLAIYIDSGGQRTEGMSEDIINAGNNILERTEAGQRDAVVSKINGLKSTVAAEEKELEDAINLRNNQKRILSGNGDVNNKDDRQYSQDILDNKDIDLGQFNTFDPTLKTTVISLMRSAAPQGYIDQMDKLASGLPIENADSYLDLFAILSNDPTKTGLFINRFGDALDQKTIELLNDANSIRTTIGGNANEIITTLVERQNDPKSSVQMDLVLGDKTPTEYATDYFGGDQIIGTELSASVEYLARSGKSKKQINARLETLKDQHYPKSTYIVDPRFPVGSIKRSRYALEKQFPDEEERKAFIAAVESNLPSDYSLDPNLSQLPEQFVSPEERRAEQKKVYLAPDESTAGVLYFSYFVDENEELRPLIFEKDGISMWPTFSKKDISDYYKKKEAENKAELDALEQKQSKGFALQKKIRDMDPSISAFTRGLGAGGL
tara:strand:- start:6650 stop:9658 length:3009 start_codon:yes stop_codon:yes gene_type:complete